MFSLVSVLFVAVLALATPKSAPTPIAAGTSPTKLAPAPSKDEPPSSLTEDDLPNSAENGDLPEPFFCQSIVEVKENKGTWINFGSDYPREVPPLQAGILSAAFTRKSSAGNLTWGTCAEAKESKLDSTIEIVMYGHVAKGESLPENGGCAWKSNGRSRTENEVLRLRIGTWSGVEFETANKENVRFTIHWPTRTQSDSTGEFCRQFAQAMNNKSFDSSELKKLKLTLP